MHRGGVAFETRVTGFFSAAGRYIFHVTCITNEHCLNILTLDMDIASDISCILFNS